MNTLSLTMRRRLGAIAGFVLFLILVSLMSAVQGGDSFARQFWSWMASLLGSAAAMLSMGRRANEPSHLNLSRWEYWGEVLWAAVCTLIVGIAISSLASFLSRANLIPLIDKTRAAACSSEIEQVTTAGNGSARAALSHPDSTKRSTSKKSTDSAPIPGKPADTLKNDLEETLKKEINDKFSFWGTLFAWLVAIVTLAVTVVIWNLQKGAQDLKDRFETLEGLREFRSNLDKHTLDVKLQDHLLFLGNTLESARDNNPVFQCLRPLQGLLLAARQVESNDFSAQDFSQRIDRVESALTQAPARVSDIQQIKPLALAAVLRTLGESLHAVGPRPWLPADWPAQIQRLFVLANRLNATL